MFHSTLIKGSFIVKRCLRIRSALKNVIQKELLLGTLFNQNFLLNTFCDCFCLLLFGRNHKYWEGKKQVFMVDPHFACGSYCCFRPTYPLWLFFISNESSTRHDTYAINGEYSVVIKRQLDSQRKLQLNNVFKFILMKDKTPIAVHNPPSQTS